MVGYLELAALWEWEFGITLAAVASKNLGSFDMPAFTS